MLDEFMIIYLDNLLIYSRSKVEHEVYLCQVFDYFCKDILFVIYYKCKFGKDFMEYLGHIIG